MSQSATHTPHTEEIDDLFQEVIDSPTYERHVRAMSYERERERLRKYPDFEGKPDILQHQDADATAGEKEVERFMHRDVVAEEEELHENVTRRMNRKRDDEHRGVTKPRLPKRMQQHILDQALFAPMSYEEAQGIQGEFDVMPVRDGRRVVYRPANPAKNHKNATERAFQEGSTGSDSYADRMLREKLKQQYILGAKVRYMPSVADEEEDFLREQEEEQRRMEATARERNEEDGETGRQVAYGYNKRGAVPRRRTVANF